MCCLLLAADRGFHQSVGTTAIGAIYRANNIQNPLPD